MYIYIFKYNCAYIRNITVFIKETLPCLNAV